MTVGDGGDANVALTLPDKTALTNCRGLKLRRKRCRLIETGAHVPDQTARIAGFRSSARRVGPRVALSSLILLFGCQALHDANANGDTRTLTFHHTHRKDDLTITFKRNGRYDDEALKTLNHYLRDWRTDEQTKMDPRLFDILWEVYRDVGGKEPINIVSSYRSPKTNAMLRRRSRGVAKFSRHMQGQAI